MQCVKEKNLFLINPLVCLTIHRILGTFLLDEERVSYVSFGAQRAVIESELQLHNNTARTIRFLLHLTKKKWC